MGIAPNLLPTGKESLPTQEDTTEDFQTFDQEFMADSDAAAAAAAQASVDSLAESTNPLQHFTLAVLAVLPAMLLARAASQLQVAIPPNATQYQIAQVLDGLGAFRGMPPPKESWGLTSTRVLPLIMYQPICSVRFDVELFEVLSLLQTSSSQILSLQNSLHLPMSLDSARNGQPNPSPRQPSPSPRQRAKATKSFSKATKSFYKATKSPSWWPTM